MMKIGCKSISQFHILQRKPLFLRHFLLLCAVNYSLSHKEVTVEAADFIRCYRDVERIRQYCLQCPGYGKSWACPPFDFDATKQIEGFKTVTVIGTTITFDEQTRAACKASDEAVAVGRQAMEEVWQTLLSKMYEMERESPGSRCFTFRCVLCPEGCNRPEGKPCRHPDLLRYSLEALGFDLVAVTRDLLGIDLEWSTDGSLAKHITLVTALFSGR